MPQASLKISPNVLAALDILAELGRVVKVPNQEETIIDENHIPEKTPKAVKVNKQRVSGNERFYREPGN